MEDEREEERRYSDLNGAQAFREEEEIVVREGDLGEVGMVIFKFFSF